ncbi:hypothetical protein EBA29_01828 [Bacillus velezensis]|nr:hypothetical protein EBA29_01828 [Bacillus velezensis]
MIKTPINFFFIVSSFFYFKNTQNTIHEKNSFFPTNSILFHYYIQKSSQKESLNLLTV